VLLLYLFVSLLLPYLLPGLRKHSCGTLVSIVNSRHDSQALRAPLTEQNGRAHFQVLGAVHETEFYVALVSRTQQVAIHVQNLGCLADHTAVDHRLIVRLDGRCVVQNDHLRIEIVSRLRID
jgi:hypothetical protein